MRSSLFLCGRFTQQIMLVLIITRIKHVLLSNEATSHFNLYQKLISENIEQLFEFKLGKKEAQLLRVEYKLK